MGEDGKEKKEREEKRKGKNGRMSRRFVLRDRIERKQNFDRNRRLRDVLIITNERKASAPGDHDGSI